MSSARRPADPVSGGSNARRAAKGHGAAQHDAAQHNAGRGEAARGDAAKDHEVVGRLGAWFDSARRDLPWRRTRDPYAIWLSEVMLQQTRVATVVDYWPRFLQKFPTVQALAGAAIDDVLGAWSGLGYYRRARSLHVGAREIVARYGGKLPANVGELESIPGIGRYTAGAIASIAFDARAPLVDGNVARVLARVYDVRDDVRGPSGARALWSIAERLVPEDRPGRHNEALMELGATVCLPRDPRCAICPLRGLCVAERENRTSELPLPVKKKTPRVLSVAALVCIRRGRVLVGRREEEGLFGGLWEAPTVEAGDASTDHEAVSGLLGSLLGWRGLSVERVATVRRTLTHRKLVIAIYQPSRPFDPPVKAPRAAPPYQAFAWLSATELSSRGMSTAARNVLAQGRQPGLWGAPAA